MAIGDDLMKNSGLMGPMTFTPEMAAQGIQLSPSATTTPARGKGKDLFPGIAPGVEDFKSVRNKMRMESDTTRAKPMGVQGPTLRPEDMRPRNPFNPSEFQAPEDDALTPPGSLAPSEFGMLGKILKDTEEILSTPGAAKFLSALGMQILPENTALGEFGMGMAESNAQQQFQQRLEAGEAAGDILVPGLSAEGRQSVQGQFESKRARGVQEDLARSQEERMQGREERLASQEERLGQQAELQGQVMEQRLQNMELENQALVRATEFAESQDPAQIANAGFEAIGEKLPEGIDLSQFSPEQAFDLVQERASIKRVQMSTQSRSSSSGIPEMSEAIRRTHIKDLGRRLAEARAQLGQKGERGGTLGTLNATALNRINEISDQILELGGDPSQFTADAPGGQGSDTPGIDKIIEMGFTREEANALPPAAKAKVLQQWLQNQAE